MSDSEGEELVFHDEIELEDFEFDDELGAYTYPCPCGDRFVITEDELEVGWGKTMITDMAVKTSVTVTQYSYSDTNLAS